MHETTDQYRFMAQARLDELNQARNTEIGEWSRAAVFAGNAVMCLALVIQDIPMNIYGMGITMVAGVTLARSTQLETMPAE